MATEAEPQEPEAPRAEVIVQTVERYASKARSNAVPLVLMGVAGAAAATQSLIGAAIAGATVALAVAFERA